MKSPLATYRLQFNASFNFKAVEEVVEYLTQLGISHIYASPIFKARRQSLHGYDIVDQNKINPGLGSEKDFENLLNELRKHGLGWIQDIVPNHMAYTAENNKLSDVFELREDSRYYNFFDIDWNHHSKDLQGRLLAPFLGQKYEDCLQKGEIQLIYDNGFKIKYLGIELPINIDSYGEILGTFRQDAERRDLPFYELAEAKQSFSLKNVIKKLCLEKKFTHTLNKYNNDREMLDKLIKAQHFKLCHWRVALKKINYRRFFDISNLICIHAEKDEVFEDIHRLVLKNLDEGKFSGLRIDHIDGLHDPKQYLKKLRTRASDSYLIAEKILMHGENLPSKWPVQGTTGYDFLKYVTGIFIAKPNEESFHRLYRKFVGNKKRYDYVLYKCKKLVIRKHFSGDIDNLSRLFHYTIKKFFHNNKNSNLHKLRIAIIELLAAFPVYRTYLSEDDLGTMDIKCVEHALFDAKQKNPSANAGLEVIEDLLKQRKNLDALRCFMRLQQFTGTIMAKGLEDTTLYVFNRLLSLNEVGSDPKVFGVTIDEFHRFNKMKYEKWPLSMNTTSTHDTKRGEDVRARLNVLSEIPAEWDSKIRNWFSINLKKKIKIGGKLVPTKNEEYHIYQTLIGAFPFNLGELGEFTDRIKSYMVKAVREAKVNSSWIEPNLEHEKAIASFIDKILGQSEQNIFFQDFLSFQKKIAYYGIFNSLSQTLLKITSPGMPDFYQGTELWDLNLVDPDNRRPVNFEERKNLLGKILKIEEKQDSLENLLKNFETGQIKLYEIYMSLKLRGIRGELFDKGDYIPLKVVGRCKENVVAFCRRKGKKWSITVVPRFLTSLIDVGEYPFGTNIWKDTYVSLPVNAPSSWKDIFTSRNLCSSMSGDKKVLQIGQILECFPVALLLDLR